MAPVNVEDLSSTFSSASSLKSEGNAHFSAGRMDDAISSYRSAIDLLDGIKPAFVPPEHDLLRASLWSNLAMCHLKRRRSDGGEWFVIMEECVKCCGEALDELDAIGGSQSAQDSKAKLGLRSKALYRRARARAELTGLGKELRHTGRGKEDEGEDEDEAERDAEKENADLNAAARDLLDLLSFDSDNKEAAALLRAIRARHGSTQRSRSPMAGAIAGLRAAEERAHTAASDGKRRGGGGERGGGMEGGGGVKKVKKATGSGDHDGDPRVKHLRSLMGLLANDLPSASMELGRLGGADLLFEIAVGRRRWHSGNHKDEDDDEDNGGGIRARDLSLQALSAASSHGPFARRYAAEAVDQNELARLISECCGAVGRDVGGGGRGRGGGEGEGDEDDSGAGGGGGACSRRGAELSDLAVHAISLLLRLVVHLDRADDPEEPSLSGADGPSVCRACVSALEGAASSLSLSLSLSSSSSSFSGKGKGGMGGGRSNGGDSRPQRRAALDLLSAWTAKDMDAVAAAAESAFLDDGDAALASSRRRKKESAGPTEEEVRRMKPRDFAAHRKRQYEISKRKARRARNNVELFCDPETGGLTAVVGCAADAEDAGLRREVCAVMGRMWACFEEGEKGDEEVKIIVGPELGWDGLQGGREEEKGLTIEEIKEEEDLGEIDDKGSDAEKREARRRLDRSIRRAHLTASLLLGRSSVGTWALRSGWSSGAALSELRDLIDSGDVRAMSVASEVIALAASVEDARSTIGPFLSDGGALEPLLACKDREIRSGAASAVAKMGLADKETSKDEGEMVGLLQVAAGLLEEEEEEGGEGGAGSSDEKKNELEAKLKEKGAVRDVKALAAVTATDRGIEVLSYLSSKTSIKEEIAHGFRASPGSPRTVLERLVELASRPASPGNQSTSSYGLASIFASIAVSVDTLKREAFEGKEITAEQYDELQSLGKTEEEKEISKKEEEHDPIATVGARIRKMGNAGVPRALVSLGESAREGATEGTTEMVVRAMCRMAVEESVRGAMVQQGCLSSCIKVDQGTSETEKKICRIARHTIAKLLISTNPALLTSSQRMGSIPPLIALVRDSDASDLMQFEALMAVTNIGSVGPETKDRIISEKGIAVLGYAMFSDHPMVRRAATEAMSNLVPHPKLMEHLADPEKMKLWVAFASDYEENFECARAATGCLAMASQDPAVASTLCKAKSFEETVKSLLECGNLELMHRILVVLLNASDHGGKCMEKVVSTGAAAFCRAYVESYQDGSMLETATELSEADIGLMQVTVDLAKEIVRKCV